MDEATTTFIDRFRPKSLEPQQWVAARPAVVDLVALAEPHCPADAKALLCALVAFLRSPCGWDRVSRPRLEALLSEATISQFGRTSGGTPHTRAVYTTNLRALVRARAGLTRAPRVVHPPVATASPLQRAAAAEGISPVALTRAHQLIAGKAASSYQLRKVRPANAASGSAGTVQVSTTATAALLAAEILKPAKEVVSAKTPRAKSTKPMSGRQRLATERADRAAAARAAAGPQLAEHPDLNALAPDIRAAIEAYRPQRRPATIWPALRPLTVRLLAGCSPVSVTSARNTATVVVRFLVWVQGRPDRPDPGSPPTAEELLGSTLLEQYLTEGGSGLCVAGMATASAASARSVLRRAVNSLDANYAPVTIPATPLGSPYSVEECDRFVAIATAQPNRGKTRNACFLLGLGLGAGLAPADLRHVRYRDIVEVHDAELGDYLTVDVRAGAVRTVVVRRQYEPLLRQAMSLRRKAGLDTPVLGSKTNRRNVTQAARRSIVTAVREPVDIDPFRLRTTWLFAALNAPIPLSIVLQQAGLKSARTLAGLLDLCPAPDPTEVARAALNLTTSPTAGSR
ncbi:hypothetical protein CELL_01600 [Cellulomonas sp. T2.31MG-18]|uniref:hypothetical protein n=1 Tax=Cellulomonas sp. T2.31MG-18 TaxID=3157619 RepID=UPI0035E63681